MKTIPSGSYCGWFTNGRWMKAGEGKKRMETFRLRQPVEWISALKDNWTPLELVPEEYLTEADKAVVLRKEWEWNGVQARVLNIAEQPHGGVTTSDRVKEKPRGTEVGPPPESEEEEPEEDEEPQEVHLLTPRRRGRPRKNVDAVAGF